MAADSRGSAVVYRPATEDDLPAAAGVFNRAMIDLYRRRGYERNERPVDVFVRPQRHVLQHDADRAFAALVDDRLVGYSSAIVRGPLWYFSALFIDPDHQGGGIGRRLFELSADGWPERRITITDAIQPISNGLYGRHGLLPSTPILVLGGEPRVERRTSGALAAVIAQASDLAAIDAVAYGVDRTIDHAFWSRTSELTAYRRGRRTVAYAYVSPTGWIGPLAGMDEEAAALALEAELARRPSVMVEIPGSAPRLVDVALRAGLEFVNPPGLLLHSAPVRLPTTLAISGYWLL